MNFCPDSNACVPTRLGEVDKKSLFPKKFLKLSAENARSIHQEYCAGVKFRQFWAAVYDDGR